MNELLDKVKLLENKLDEDRRIILVKDVLERINSDKKLCLLINDYKNNYCINNEKIIKENPLYLEYLEYERDINILISEINKKFEFTKLGKDCSKCGVCDENN